MTISLVLLVVYSLLKLGVSLDQCMVSDTLFANFYGMKVRKVPYPNLKGEPPSGRVYEDPCHISFLTQYQFLGLQDRTRFGKRWCKPLQCTSYIRPVSRHWPLCAPRRRMLQWQPAKSFLNKDLVTKIDCSSLNMPTFQDGTKFTDYRIRQLNLEISFQSNNFKIPYTKEMLNLLEGLKPNWLRVSYPKNPYELGNESSNQPLFSDIIDKFKDVELAMLRVLSPQPALNLSKEILKMKNLRSLSVWIFDLHSTEFISHPEKLEFFSMARINEGKNDKNLNVNPSWLKRAKNLLSLYYRAVPNFKNFDNMDELESLEIIRIYQTQLKNIPKNLLARSKHLKSLDFRCNEISVIEPGALDKFVELELLLLSGNNLAVIEPPVLSSLTSVRALDLRTPYVRGKQWGFRLQVENGWENFDLCQYSPGKPVVMFQNKMTVDHFKNLGKLEFLLLGHNPNATFDPEIFSYMKNLKKLEFENMGLKDMAPLHRLLEGSCDIEEMVLNWNKFNKEDWLPYEWVSNSLKLNAFYVTKSQISKASVPMALMAKKSRDTIWGMEKGLIKTPLWENSCEKEIWGSLLRNMETLDERLKGVSEECKARYIKMRTEMIYWEKRIYNVENVKYCAHNLNKGIPVYDRCPLVVLGASFMLAFIVKSF